MKTRSLALLPAAVLLATLAACGSDDGDSKAVDQPGGGAPEFDLTTDLGCGYGFARVDDDGTALLTIYHEPGGGTVDGQVVLPDPDWTAKIEVGQDLDANWCSDVIVDPQASVDKTYTIVEGTLSFRGEVPHFDGRDNDQPVRAQLTGVVVAENSDSQSYAVGDIPLSNNSFGFFAG
jgi:hypothetical protein